MSKIQKAAEFGKRMGKIAANNQFIGPAAPAGPPAGGYLNYFRNQPTPAARPAKDALMPYSATTPNAVTASRMLSGQAVPQGMREKDYVMGLDKAINQRMSNARPGTVAGELERQQGESSAKAFNTMASTLGTMGAGHVIGHGINPLVNRAMGSLTSTAHPVVKAVAPHAGKHVSNLAGHLAAVKGTEAIGGTPVHMTSASTPQLGLAVDAAKAIPAFMGGGVPHAMAGLVR